MPWNYPTSSMSTQGGNGFAKGAFRRRELSKKHGTTSHCLSDELANRSLSREQLASNERYAEVQK